MKCYKGFDKNMKCRDFQYESGKEYTEGLLHVSEVYLNDLKYIDLELKFEDGKVTEYRCGNFDNEEDGKKFIKENSNI